MLSSGLGGFFFYNSIGLKIFPSRNRFVRGVVKFVQHSQHATYFPSLKDVSVEDNKSYLTKKNFVCKLSLV